MYSQFTSQARTALSLAGKAASDASLGYIGTEHILLGLIREKNGTAGAVLLAAGVDQYGIKSLMDTLVFPPSESDVVLRPEYTPRAVKALHDALEIAAEHGERQAGTDHLLMAILRQRECTATRLLNTAGVNTNDLYREILKASGEDAARQKDDFRKLRQNQNERTEQQATPTLDRYSRDLTQMAAENRLDPVIGRDDEINRVIEILSRRKKNNPCLIGEPGVGKTAVAEGLAERIASGDVPEKMKGKKVVILDISGMVAGSKYRGEFEERIKNVLKEVTANKNILLFVDELHTIIGAGGAEGALDASNIMKPSLARGEIQLIGATTIGEYRKYIEKDPALERRFQPVMVEQPSDEDTLKIARGIRYLYEDYHHVKITDEALEAAVRMSSRYLSDRNQPDKTIDLIDETASRVELGASGTDVKGGENVGRGFAQYKKTAPGENCSRGELSEEILRLRAEKERLIEKGDFEEAGRIHSRQMKLQKSLEASKNKEKSSSHSGGPDIPKVTENDIAETVSLWTGIPVEKVAEKESKRLARLERILHERVVGQDEAVSAVSKAIVRSRVGLKDPGRPIGSFLFLGPTGVGKTELSKALAGAVFGSESDMIRVDMSEYMEKASVSKLIGSPPGYVGYEEGGQLSEKVRRHPYSVVLFDEIEKAHPDVFNILLQVLDEGHITDSQGRKVSFKDTIIIMTSNAGANRIVQPRNLGFGAGNDAKADYESMKNQVMDEIRNVFRPEFLNRIDGILVFHSLTKEDMKKITRILLKELTERSARQMKINLRVTDTAVETLVNENYDVRYGARPLKRAIQTSIEDPLAAGIINGSVSEGDSVTVGSRGGKIVFKKR